MRLPLLWTQPKEIDRSLTRIAVYFLIGPASQLLLMGVYN